MTPEPVPGAAPEVVRHEQHLHVRTERVPHGRVVLRRHVATETRQIEVTVRREELHVHREPLHDQHPTAPTARTQPLVIVLSEEVPVVERSVRPYQRVTVHVDTVTEQRTVTGTVATEQVDVDVVVPAEPPR